MPSTVQLQRVVYPAAGSAVAPAPSLSNDTSLATFTIDAEDVLEQSNIQRGNGVTEVAVVAVPTHAGATRTINGSADADPVMLNLSTGDNVVTVTVTAEDGVTTEDHVVTVRRLTAGVQEITTVDFSAIPESHSAFVVSSAEQRHGFFFSNDSSGDTPPDLSSYGVTQYHAVNIEGAMSANAAAAAVTAAVNAVGHWSASDGFTTTVTITDDAPGARTDATNVDSSVTVTVTQQGANPS
jgi:hypothetical protein